MRHYELVTILSPMLNQDEASATWDEIKAFISNRDGEITAEQVWGTRRLAYPIRKGNYNFLEGAYYLSSFTSDNPFNRELETYLRLDERVLRSLVVRCAGPLEDKPPPGPLTAPSRYISPGRGRRPDGGGPIPDGGFGDRRSGPPPSAAPSAPAPAGDPAAPAPSPVADAAPAAPPSSDPAAAAPSPAAPPGGDPAAPAPSPVADAAPAAPPGGDPAAPAPSPVADAAPAAPPGGDPAAVPEPTPPPIAEPAPEPVADAPPAEPPSGDPPPDAEA